MEAFFLLTSSLIVVEVIRLTVIGIFSLILVAIAWPILFWMGRTSDRQQELVVDPDIDSDDSGREVD